MLSLCCADSKALSEEKREHLFQKLQACGRIGYITMSISAEEISEKMLQKVPYSLNAISHDAAIELIRLVQDKGVNVSKVYVDTVGDQNHYQNKLGRVFQNRIDFTVSKKADSLYKCVSAASIAAKVTRDRALDEWVFVEPFLKHLSATEAAAAKKKGPSASSVSSPSAAPAPSSRSRAAVVEDEDEDGEHAGAAAGAGAADSDADSDIAIEDGEEGRLSGTKRGAPSSLRGGSEGKKLAAGFDSSSIDAAIHPSTAGSGYPGDPLTKAWLGAHIDPVFGWPTVMRFSWATAKELLEQRAVSVLWEEEEEEAGKKGGAADGEGAGAGGASRTQSKLKAFFGAGATAASTGLAASGKSRSMFFRRRHLHAVEDAL